MKNGYGYLFLVLSSVLTLDASAYTPMRSGSGKAIKWHGERKLNLAGNPENRAGISASFLFDQVVRSLQRWSFASSRRVRFDYWQGTNPEVYEANSNYNGLSSLYFSSQTGNADPGVVGLTEVWFEPDTGKILETDISLNDVHFRFTQNEFGGGIYLPNVITHELGHAYGLSHSGLLDASMLYVEASGQVSLHCDDQAGIKDIYSATAGRGRLQGRVVGPSGQAIFGAHVVAIDQSSSEQVASAITSRSGHYTINGLPAGTYYVMAEPFLGGVSALPSYYRNITRRLCGSFDYSRAYASSDGLNLDTFTVSAGGRASVPTIDVGCGGASSSSLVAVAPTEFSSDALGFVGEVEDEVTYPLALEAGTWTFSFLDYRLLSQIESEARLYDFDGNEISPDADGSVLREVEGADRVLVFNDLEAGDYELVLSAESISRYEYPASLSNQERSASVLVSAHRQEALPEYGEWVDQLMVTSAAPSRSCVQNEATFPAYSSPPGAPIRQDIDGVGFCGWVQDSDGNAGPPPGGTPPNAVIGWSIPWLLALLFGRLTVAQAARLSRPARVV
jgi:hypothetical protein